MGLLTTKGASHWRGWWARAFGPDPAPCAVAGQIHCVTDGAALLFSDAVRRVTDTVLPVDGRWRAS